MLCCIWRQRELGNSLWTMCSALPISTTICPSASQRRPSPAPPHRRLTPTRLRVQTFPLRSTLKTHRQTLLNVHTHTTSPQANSIENLSINRKVWIVRTGGCQSLISSLWAYARLKEWTCSRCLFVSNESLSIIQIFKRDSEFMKAILGNNLLTSGSRNKAFWQNQPNVKLFCGETQKYIVTNNVWQ